MRIRQAAVLLASLISLCLSQTSLAQDAGEGMPSRRVALLFGVTNYQSGRPLAEARAAAASLGQAVFQDLQAPCMDVDRLEARLLMTGWKAEEIQKVCNPDTGRMLTMLRETAEFLVSTPRSFGFVYFAAHGIEVNGRNYIFGREARPNLNSAASALRGGNPNRPLFGATAVNLQSDFVEHVNVGCNCDVVVILDTCRDDPLAFQTVSQALNVPVTAPKPPRGFPRGIGVFYATDGGERILETNPSHMVAGLDAKIRPDMMVMEILADTKDAVRLSTEHTRYPQDPPLIYAPRQVRLFFQRRRASWIRPMWLNQQVGGGLLRLADFRRSQASSAPTPARATGTGPEIFYDPEDAAAAREAGAIGVDIYWCDGDGRPARQGQARAYAQTVADLARRRRSITGVPLGRVRVRQLDEAQNRDPSLRIYRDLVRTENGSVASRGWAARLAGLGGATLNLEVVREGLPQTVNVFFCAGRERLPQAEARLWIHAARDEQRSLAVQLGQTVRLQMDNVWVENEIEIINESPTVTQVRYYHEEDRSAADRVAGVLESPLGKKPSLRWMADLQARAPLGLVELWLGQAEMVGRRRLP
jgi:hypothetical protein